MLCHVHNFEKVTGWRSGEVKQLSWVNYLFPRVNKADLVTRLALSTNEEIAKRISASISSYTIESNEDRFKPDVIFESFHHQAKTSITDRALLVIFLMLWLKRCVVPTLPYEVIIADVVYPAILLAYGKSIALLPVMVARIQSELRALTNSFCQVEAIVDVKGNPVKIPMVIPWLRLPVQGSTSIHLSDGLVCDALSITNDRMHCIRIFCTLHASAGEL